MIEEIFSPGLVSAVRIAKSMASDDGFQSYGVAHLGLALLREETGLPGILKSLGKDVGYLVDWFQVHREIYQPQPGFGESMDPDHKVLYVFEEAERSKLKLGTDYVDAVCVFTAMVRKGVVYDKKQLDTINVSEEELLAHYDSPIRADKNLTGDEGELFIQGINYCTNLMTRKNLDEGALIVGRDKEIRTIFENLERQENGGVLIVGDSGVGKTGLIKALLKYVSDAGDPLNDEKLILGLNVSKLLANSVTSNELSKKLSDIFDKVEKLEECLLIIDDIHILTEAGQGNSSTVINLIAAQLTEGKVNLIATINPDAYRKTIEKHGINRKFDLIDLEELDELLLSQCLENHRLKLAAYYQINISKEAVSEAVFYSRRYFKESKLPYGAIKLLDRTLASVQTSNKYALKEIENLLKQLSLIENDHAEALVNLKVLYRLSMDKISPVILNQSTNEFDMLDAENAEDISSNLSTFLNELKMIAATPVNEISRDEIAAVVASITGIPIGKIQAEEKEKLLNIEQKLEERVKGQHYAISTLSDAILESRSGLSNPKQPIGSFFFLGPTGTGKTELTKSLAELLFDDENAMIRFDMSEFKEEHSAALLYGAPPGYVGYEEGGMLVNKIRQKPYSVVLFDEIEKAHSSVYDVFLQIMDEGQIHDKLGRKGDFSNSIIIFTSNIGSQWIADQIDSGQIPSSNQLIEVMSKDFRPEFLGRLTEVVPFAPINHKVAELIFKLQFKSLQDQLSEQKEIELNLSNEALKYLAQKGYSKKYGARPVSGVIRTYVKKVISRMIVAEVVVPGDKVILDYKDEALAWEKR